VVILYLYSQAQSSQNKSAIMLMARYLNHHPGPASKKELANLLRKRRKIGENLPPVYPNGWFRLFDSLQVKAGQVKEISALGKYKHAFDFLYKERRQS